jgi:hypothetical protein
MIGKRARAGVALAMMLNLVFASLIFVPLVGAATVVITPANAGNWTIQDETCGVTNTGIYDYIAGPGTPPLGIGSARFRIGADGDSYGGWRNSDFHGVRLDNLDALSYSTYVSNYVDGQAPYMTLAVDADGEGEFTPGEPGSNDATLFFEPVYQNGTYSGDPVPNQGNVTLNTWQTWDALAGGWWNGTGGPPLITLASFVTANPDATIISAGPGLGGLTVRVGCGGAAWANFVGNMDNLTVAYFVDGTNERAETVFDFDSIPQCTTTCYVNASTGNDVTKGGTSPSDAKQTIQAAVDTVNPGGTVIVAAGTYPERVVIGKALTLQGPNVGVNPNTGTRGAEATIVPPSNSPTYSPQGVLVTLAADDITVNGFTIDGDNPSVGGGIAMNGADANAYFGIANEFNASIVNTAAANDATIANNIIRNLGEGVDLYRFGLPGVSTGTQISNNRFSNMALNDGDNGLQGRGIILGDNYYASITGNVMERVYIGVQTNNFNLAGSPATISNNQISSYNTGILHNLHYQSASPFTISGNTLTTADYANWVATGAVTGENRNYGLLIWSIQETAGVNVSDNVANGNLVGIGAWNVPTTNTVTVNGGSLTGNGYGVLLYSCDEDYGAASAGTLRVRGTTVANSSIAGLAVLDDPGANVACALATQPQLLDVREVYESGPAPVGILADGPQARLTVTRSSIQGNTTGIAITDSAQAAPAGIHFNVIVANGTGLNATGSTGAIDAENNWWGCNAGPGAPGCDTINASADANPWLTLRLTRTPGGATAAGGTVFTLTGDIIINSDGQDTSGIDTILDGTPVAYAVVSGGGTVAPTSTGTVNGVTTATYTAANACGPATVSATSDDQTVTTAVTIVEPCDDQVTLTLTTSGSGSVQVTPPGGSFTSTSQDYTVNTVVTLVPTAGTGQTFVGWMVDGAFSGWAPSLTITMNDDRAVEAMFANTRTFPDVGPARADYEAITELASRGYILGFGNGTYGPDKGVLRSEMAALIARATPKSVADDAPNLLTPPDCIVANTWDCEVWNDVNLTDIGDLDPNLQRNIRTLAHYGVALGYDGPACTAGGRAYPCYGPSDPVTYAQTISFITRAMQAKGYWTSQPGAPQPYAGVPSAHDVDMRTFVYYTGGVPAPPANWNGNASRGWFAQALWAALNSYWGNDGFLPDGDPAGGYQP